MKKIVILLLLSTLLIPVLSAANKDFLFSLAIPGSSQIRNERNLGYILLGAEAALIGSTLYLNREATLKQDEAYIYAIKYAHIKPAKYDKEFLKNVGKYQSSGYDAMGYNAMIRQEAIKLFPNDYAAQQAFIEANAYDDDHYWKWDNKENRSQYNALRNKSKDLKSFGVMTSGMIILNHIISGIDALKYGAKERRSMLSVQMADDTTYLNLFYRF